MERKIDIKKDPTFIFISQIQRKTIGRETRRWK